MKKLLHITAQYPGRTGSEIYLKSLIKEGKRKGYKNALIGAIPKGKNNLNIDIPYDKFYPVIFETEALNFPIVGMSDVMPYRSTKYCDLDEDMLFKWKNEFTKVIKKAIKEYRPDITILHHLWILTALVTKVAPEIKTIAVCHGTDLRQFNKCPQYREYVIEGCNKLDLVLSLNNEQNEKINKVYNIPERKIVTIGGGYDNTVFYSSEKKADIIKIIYAGKLSYAKGVISLINAYNKLNIDREEVELSIIGSGMGMEEEKIKEAGYRSRYNIKFIGEVNQNKLGKIFRKSHIFVLPSFYEGLSLVTLEAIASGLFVVTTEIEGLKSFLGKEINSSGIIEYVKLPKMSSIDQPVKEELPGFEKRLAFGIKKQINRIEKGFIINEKIENKIKNFSWNNIFNKIEYFF